VRELGGGDRPADGEALDQREDLLAVSLLVARPASTEPANGPRAVSQAVRAVATDGGCRVNASRKVARVTVGSEAADPAVSMASSHQEGARVGSTAAVVPPLIDAPVW
jgi:hypothetical protein